MKNQEYKVLGHKVTYSVPETSEEFNKLDPKRPDAACSEAVANIVYRSLNPDTRHWFLHGLDADDIKALVEGGKLPAGITPEPWVGVEADSGIDRKIKVLKDKSGKERSKDGQPVTAFDESEETYYNRVLAELVVAKKYASEDAARAHFEPAIIRMASYVPFDVTRPEGDRGPKKLAAKYKISAAKSITIGNLENVNKLLSKINKTYTPSGDTSKMFTGTYPDLQVNAAGEQVEVQVPFNVSDKDAEALGELIREYQNWKERQELTTFGG